MKLLLPILFRCHAKTQRLQRRKALCISLHTILFASILFFHFSAKSQHVSQAMQFVSPVKAGDSNKLFLAYSNLAYFKNYEYFNDIQAGYTLFGIWQYPRLSYIPNKWMKIEAGALLQMDFGDQDFSRVFPTFSLQLQSNNGYRFLFGALEGNQSHQLIEPLLQYDQVIERPIEEGVQLKINKKKFYADIWLDWQKRQSPQDPDNPEQLSPGAFISYTFTDPAKSFQVKIPLQAILFHRGGQLDTSNIPTYTISNYAAGLWMEWNNPDKQKWLQQLRADAYYVGYKQSKDDRNTVPFTNGDGFMANIYLRSKWDVSFLATYWNGKDYIAPQGGKLFQSVSSRTDRPGHTEPMRQLLFLNFIYEKELLPGFFVDCRFTPDFDLNNNLFEYSYQVFLSYRHDFRLGTIQKKKTP